MKLLTIGELERESGVSKRSLRHYDEIGLLIPSQRTDAGYRLYSREDLRRLHSILLYRSLGFGLEKIADILAVNPADSMISLREQLRLVTEHKQRLAAIEAKLQQLIDIGDHEMADLEVFGSFDPDNYQVEVLGKWGDTPQYQQARSRTRSYSSEDWKRVKAEQDENYGVLVELMRAGTAPEAPEAIRGVDRIREHINTYFYDCSPGGHAQLAEMYHSDERFGAFFESLEPGFTEYLCAAIRRRASGTPEQPS